jgi:hypothetical protein
MIAVDIFVGTIYFFLAEYFFPRNFRVDDIIVAAFVTALIYVLFFLISGFRFILVRNDIMINSFLNDVLFDIITFVAVLWAINVLSGCILSFAVYGILAQSITAGILTFCFKLIDV